MTVRKRMIYAHADILMRRSEYFSTMLSSAFVESAPPGERKIYTVIVEEADFVTVYWLLKWVYANWLLFSEEDDPRMAVEGTGTGWSARWLTSSGIAGEWDWKSFNKSQPVDETRDDVRSATSGESVHSVQDGPRQGEKAKLSIDARATSPRRRNPSNTKPPQPLPSMRASTSTLPRRSGVPQHLNAHTPGAAKPAPVPIPGVPTHYPLSPHSHRSGSNVADPHTHPAPQPPPASALSMYQIAHRYGMPRLATLALEHMMSTISPQSGFALLLASTVWEELHGLVEVYPDV